MNVKKILIIVGIIVALTAIVGFTVNQSQRNLVAVQTGKVVRQDISSTVSASGQINPRMYVNVGANSIGRIVHLYVKEGDKVKRGQTLAQLDNIQSAAELDAMRATLQSNQTDAVAQEAAYNTAVAQLESSRADLARAKLDYDRAQGLLKDQLIAKSDFDTKKATYDIAVAAVAQNQARVSQAKAQVQSAHGHVLESQANIARLNDVVKKTVYSAPFDGVITNLPVREGETVVVGIQNSPGSTLMTIADMSVITAEVHVDETDIINVKNGQDAEVTVDAMPGQVFKGKVTEIGDNAIIRSTGVSTSQSTTGSQEAKDFKVVVTLTNPPDNLRPGLSATAKITTATGHNVLTVPIQALTIRDKNDLQESKPGVKTVSAASAKKEKEEIQGVFVVSNQNKAEFHPVKTGTTGATDIEVKEGLQDGDQIVTGSYKVLRTLKNGVSVKVDNSLAKQQS